MRHTSLFLRVAPVLALAVLLFPAQAAAVSPPTAPPMATGGIAGSSCINCLYDSARMSLKANHQITYSSLTGLVSVESAASVATAFPSAAYLNTSTSWYIEEPEGGWTHDDATPGTYYRDDNYWAFCAPGAITVLASYFGGLNPPMVRTGWFAEPYIPTPPQYTNFYRNTYWNATDHDSRGGYLTYARAYIMYQAEGVMPTNPTSSNIGGTQPGVDGWGQGPTKRTDGASIGSISDALNWEMSHHNALGPWPGFFWAVVQNTGTLYRTALHPDVLTDISMGLPVLVTLDAEYLVADGYGNGNWGALSRYVPHAISIVGYDDTYVNHDGSSGVYYYMDTCGAQCSGGTDGGMHRISQTKILTGIRQIGKVDANGNLITNGDGSPKYPIGGYVW
jgi:hypothetical protein